MTTPTPPASEPEPMTFAEIRALLEQTAVTATENTRAIAAMRAGNAERAARHDREMAEIRESITEARAEQKERAAQHDREMAEIREAHNRAMERLTSTEALAAENAKAIAEMRASQARIDRRFERLMESHRETRETVAGFRGKLDYTSQDVSTLKGWGLEFLCERRPGDFARALNLSSIELFPREKMSTMAMDAAQRGIIHGSEAIDLDSGDVYFYGQRAEDDTPVYLIVQVSFAVSKRDVKRASSQADTLDVILRHEGPPEVTGVAIPVVAGTRLGIDPVTGSMPSLWDVTFVQIENGNQLTA